jgi:CRISPR/Cas system CMR-associated protein Cmr5 small subunit
MAGKKGGKSSGFISQGIHRNVKTSTVRAMKSGYKQSFARVVNQQKALAEGKDIVVTIENPNKEQVDRRFIRVRISGRDYVQAQKNNMRMQKVADA